MSERPQHLSEYFSDHYCGRGSHFPQGHFKWDEECTIRSNLEVSDSVLVFVREVIWHQAGGYNWNIMPQILSFLTHVTALLHFYYNFLTLQNQRHLLVLFLCMNFNTTRWSCHRQRHALNSAKHIFGKIFLIIQVFICEIIQQ